MATKITALKFNGVSQFATLNVGASIKNLENFTFLAWVKVGASSTKLSQRAYTELSPTNGLVRFAMTPLFDRLRFELAVQDDAIDTNYDYLYNFPNDWTHVGFTARINSETPSYEIFVNGIEKVKGRLVKGGLNVERIPNTAPRAVYLANHKLKTTDIVGSLNNAWHGKLSDILIFDGALPAEDVLSIYTQKDTYVPIEGDGFKYYWPLGDSNAENAGPLTLTEYGGLTGTVEDGVWRGTGSGVPAGAVYVWTTDRPYAGLGVGDTTPPAAPTWASPAITDLTARSAFLHWNAATDNFLVDEYEIHVSQTNIFSAFDTTIIENHDPRNFFPNGSAEDTLALGTVESATLRIEDPTLAATSGNVILSSDVIFRGTKSWRFAQLTTHERVNLFLNYNLPTAASPVPTRVGERFSLSFWVKATQSIGTLLNNVYIQPIYEGGAARPVFAEPITLTGDWQRVVLEGVQFDPSLTLIAITANIGREGAHTSNILFFVDGIQLLSQGAVRKYPSVQNNPMLQLTDLLPNTNYYVRVKAFDEAGNESAYSTTQSFTTATIGDVTAPNPPTSLSSSLVTHLGYRIGWTLPSAPDLNGLKLDIAYDLDFNEYVQGYQNRQIGLSTSFDVTDALPLTTYYARLRAYDTDGNESIESNVIAIQTLPLPDTTPPTDVPLSEPSSIEPRAFTANWLQAEDDVGVIEYFLDVALDAEFTQILPDYLNKNVGLVLSYRVEELSPTTTYFYRVRAGDAAGNISVNGEQPVSVITKVPTITDGGIVSITLDAIEDTHVSSTNPTNNYSTSPTLTTGGDGTNAVFRTLLLFDLRDVIGQITEGMLSLFVKEPSTASHEIRMQAVSFDADTVTFNDRPVLSGSPTTVTPLTDESWISVDVSSFLTSGNTFYTVEILTTNVDGALFASLEGGPVATLYVESNPEAATEVDKMSLSSRYVLRRNSIRNPSFETNTAFWSAVNGTSGTATLSRTQFSDNSWGLKVDYDGVSVGQGVESEAIVADTGERWVLSVAPIAITAGFRVFISEYGAVPGTILAESSYTFTADDVRLRDFVLFRTLTHPDTTHIRARFLTSTVGGAGNFTIDRVMLEKAPYSEAPSYFDGDVLGAWWESTAHGSGSLMNASVIDVTASYIGDSDDDNSVGIAFKRADQDDFLVLDAATSSIVNNRSTKIVTAIVPSNVRYYNVLDNASFENEFSTLYTEWVTVNALLTRSTEQSFHGAISGAVQTTLNAAGAGITTSLRRWPVLGNQTWSASAMVKIPVGMRVGLSLVAQDTSFATISSSPTVVGESATLGTDEWTKIKTTWQLPSNAAWVHLRLLTETATLYLGTFYADAIMLHQGSQANPYLDPTMIDGYQTIESRPTTTFLLSPSTLYDVRLRFTDQDGVVGGSDYVLDVGASVTTPTVQDNLLTVGVPTFVARATEIDVVVPYEGDDNENASVRVAFRRTDLASWNEVIANFDRAAKRVFTTISGLNPGTNYTVRVTVSDPDGTYGANPVSFSATTDVGAASPEVTPRITFGGFVLMGRDDEKIGVTNHEGVFGFPNRRVQIESLPRVDGAVELENLWGERLISMSGFVSGSTRSNLEDTKNALKAALAPRQQQLIVDTLSTHGRFFYATCTSFVVPENPDNFRHLSWDAEFVCADPFAYALKETELTPVLVSSGTQIALQNDGDILIAPSFRFTTAHTSSVRISLINRTTGQFITALDPISSVDVLDIDSARFSLTRNSVEVDYVGEFPELAVGSNLFEVQLLSPAGVPSATVSARWRLRYL